MKRTRIIAAAALLLVTTAVWLYGRTRGGDELTYRFATVERGDLEASVSATGTLGAVTTVQVGTQVSGQVSAILVDFNDRVRKGQLIARIDPTLQQQAVRDAQAGLDRSRAELERAEDEYQRTKRLHEQKVVTDAEFSSIEYQVSVARANLKSAEVTLDRARRNLAYTSIYAPIDGIVVERNVDVGQTVAASLSAPQLFLIANDLARMQILAAVDESDIGLIAEGMPARFTVQAYPGERFTGAVRQVRLQSTTQENVVNYTVVVEVANEGGKLLPGMTATVDFLTGSAEDVLMVPNGALRFRPPDEMLGRLDGPPPGPAGAAEPAPAGDRGRERDDARRGNGVDAPRSESRGTLWYLTESGEPAALQVRTGITDGRMTEVEGPGLREGMQVIVGVTQASRESEGPASPFQSQSRDGGRRRGGGF